MGDVPKELGGIMSAPVIWVDGRQWNLYSVDYDTADGKFSTYIYAISFEHAAEILEELKETAKIGGQVCGVYGA